MNDMTPQAYRLSQEIIFLSNSKSWDMARLEWELEEIYHEDTPDTCLCGHTPINEICILKNTKNNNRAVVGNVCVKKFLKLSSHKIFDAFNRVSSNISASLNPDAISHALKKSWISPWEEKFYLDTWRKKSLTGKQETKRREINERIVRCIKNSRKKQ